MIARILTTLTAILITGCAFPGQRVLHLEIYKGEQLVLRTMFSAPDYEGAAEFWLRAGTEPLASEAELALVKADEGHPLRATLTGSVRIKIMHVDRLMTSASLTNLMLLRSAPESLKWYLAPEGIQLAMRAAQGPATTVISHDQRAPSLFGIPLFALFVGSVFLAALAGLTFGVFRWRHRFVKILAIACALILLLLALAIILVLITVGSGSMG